MIWSKERTIWLGLALVGSIHAFSIPYIEQGSSIAGGLRERQLEACTLEEKLVSKVGTLYKHKQLTDPHSWPAESSTTSEESVTFSAEVAGGSFATLGLGVSKSLTFGQSHSCPAVEGKTSCVYVAVGYMQYLAQGCPKMCPAVECGDAYSIKAPLKTRDVTYYCRYDDGPAGKNCPRQGNQFWKQTEPSCSGGGPKVKRC